jgi:DNA-binding MarR family transcriptional regulator
MLPRTRNVVQPTSAVQVLRRFRVVFNAVRAHFQEIEKQVGLGGAQVWALNVIRDQPGLGVGALAKSMDIHQSTASNLVKVLQRKELISMCKASTDRRQVELQILPAGLAILSQVPGPFEGILPGALNQLSAATLLRLDKDLSELTALLKADEKAAGIPLAHL